MIVRIPVAALLAALVLTLAACATPDPNTQAGEVIAAPSPPGAGTVLTYATFNAYNDEPRSIVRHSFDAGSSRIEGMDYETPGEGGFGDNRARVVNRVLDARGDVVRLERADGSSVSYEPPMRMLPFPLRPGTRFHQRVMARESDGSPPRTVVVTGRVAGWEMVTVPAGQFRAMRVVRDQFLGDHQFYRTQTVRQETDWYAPQIGAVVRAFENSHFDDLQSGGDESSGSARHFGDWLRWELRAVNGKTVK